MDINQWTFSRIAFNPNAKHEGEGIGSLKIKNYSDENLSTTSGSIFFSLFGLVLGLLILTGPDWATSDLPKNAVLAMRLTGIAILVLAAWTATSKTLSVDLKVGRVVWQRKFALLPFVPFLNHRIEMSVSDVSEVVLHRTKNGQVELGNLNLRMTDGTELRLTHVSLGYDTAKKMHTKLQTWFDQNLPSE